MARPHGPRSAAGAAAFTRATLIGPVVLRRSPPASHHRHDVLLAVVAAAIVAAAGQALALIVARRDPLIVEWRPTDLAAIALNYYRHGFHLLRPEVLWGGAGSGAVEMEFPLVPFAIAGLYRLLGVHEWVALVPPILAGVLLVVVTALMAGRAAGTRGWLAAAGAGLALGASPTWLDMSTSLYPDLPSLAAGAVGLLVLTRWVASPGPWSLVFSALAVALSILLKLTALHLGVPALYLFWSALGRRWWKTPAVWCFGAIALGPPLWWYAHAHALYRETGNTFGILGAGYLKFATWDLLVDPMFYGRTLARAALFHLTPVGFALALIGLASIVRHRQAPGSGLLVAWLAGAVVDVLVAARGVSIGHFQYLLVVLPPGAALAGLGLTRLIEPTTRWLNRWPQTGRRLVIAGAGLLIAANLVAAHGIYRDSRQSFRLQSLQKLRTGRLLLALSRPDDLVIVVDAEMDDRTPRTSMTPPDTFYAADRRGWYRSMAWLSLEEVAGLSRLGARYLAVSANHVDYFRTNYPDLRAALGATYRTLVDGDDGAIYELVSAADR